MASSDGRGFHVWRRAKMQSRRGLRSEGAWLARVGGASACGGGAKMQSSRGLRLEGAWLVRVGGASTCGGGATSHFAR